MFASLFAGKRAIVVTDATLYEIAAKRVIDAFTREGVAQELPFVFEEKRPYADMTHVDLLTARLASTDAIPVVVGSGSLNDMAKLASHRTARPYLCVATAASMDGYTAYGASIAYNGNKQTFTCPAPAGVVADLDIICAAPSKMTAAGYADLLAKITAGADWILADALDLDPINEVAFHIVQDGLEAALADPLGAKEGREEAIRPLIEGLILGGFAMQWSQTSRPASGAEHLFSHLWDMEHHTYHGVASSHGFNVAIGVLAVTELYEELLSSDLSLLDIDACCARWIDVDEAVADTRRLLAGTDFVELGAAEVAAKHVGCEELRQQLTLLKTKWSTLKPRLEKQLLPLEEVKRRFRLVGAPYDATHIGISPERLHASYLRAQKIRRRFTVLDLAEKIVNHRFQR